jgi:hypothetical protein
MEHPYQEQSHNLLTCASRVTHKCVLMKPVATLR